MEKEFTNIIFELKEQPLLDSLSVAEEIIKSTLGIDWIVKKIDSILPHYITIPKNRNICVKDAWDYVHKLEKDTAISYAEPDFETKQNITLLGGLIDCDEHLSGTESAWWHHQQVDALEAYKLKPRHQYGTTLGKGILIGHIDTGYSYHPEIWQQNLLFKRGYDYKDNKSDPLEPNWGWQKGHGTSTSSVIFSYHNHGHINGIAPSANLIPIRVDDTVIVNMTRLIKGIGHAIREGCHIISISMGNIEGNPDGINSALKIAVDNGCIPICAAGQAGGWPIDIYPSKSPYSISVTATDVRERPWHKAFKTRYADVAAPGVSIWNAIADYDNDRFIVDRGCGTSFSTAITAGAAAIWLGSWTPEYIWSLNGKQNTMATFRNVLYKYGVKTPLGWDTENFGQGILNIKTLLTQNASNAKIPESKEVEDFEEKNTKQKYPMKRVEYLTSLLNNKSTEEAIKTLSNHLSIDSAEFEKKIAPVNNELTNILMNNHHLLSNLNEETLTLSETKSPNNTLLDILNKNGSDSLKKIIEK